MFHSPRAPYSTSNNLKKITPNFYMRPYILSHVVLTFFASDPPPRELDLQTLVSQPIMTKNLLDHCSRPFTLRPQSESRCNLNCLLFDKGDGL